MKRSSESAFGVALRGVDLSLHVFKPPDDARNRKPCDFMVWHREINPPLEDEVVSTWFEVKDVDAVETFPFSELRQAQLLGIRDAARIGIPYWLAVYWRKHRSWTISDAAKLLAGEAGIPGPGKSISRNLLMSRFGVDATPGSLGSVLKSILLGDI